MRNPELWKKLESTAITFSDGTEMASVLSDRLGISYITEVAGYLNAYTRFLYVAAVSGETLRPDIYAEKVWRLHQQDGAAWAAYHHNMFGKLLPARFGQGDHDRDPTYERTMELVQQEFPSLPGLRSCVDDWLAARQARRRFWHHVLTGLAMTAVLAIFAGPGWASLGILATLIYLVVRGLAALNRKFPSVGEGYDGPYL